ncbi:MAG TPA: dTDP-4-amino-4,6-dideoxygalactose transaminase [Thermoanaerobaculia bacterium]|nr:dTDP-4-amino-4,6-dideoxygalactose transaminase [Thermoanaerobaculia bacterium]
MIPFNRSFVTGREIEYLREAIASGHIAGDGPFTQRCHEILERELSVRRALLTTSCTDAMEMSALLLNIAVGDEVIIPSFTFVSVGNAFALRGAKIVFADIRPDTLNIDEKQLAPHLTDRTRAVVVVHYAGVGCEMESIMSLSERRGVEVVEDNAHGLFGTYKNRFLGTFGRFSTLSFHETKNFSAGEGGALLINDAKFIARAEVIREKGTNRSQFFRGQVDKYTWLDIGSSFLPSELTAAHLTAQLESKDRIQRRRCELWQIYFSALEDWARENDARLPFVPEHCGQAYHMFYLLLPTLELRGRLIAHLRAHGIHAVFHYLPLHRSEMGKRFGAEAGDCPVSNDISDRLVRLPFFTGLGHDEQMQVIDAVRAWRC